MAPADDDLLTAYRAARAQRATLARDNVNVFVEYVLRDEQTGRPLTQTPLHAEWHRLLDEHPRLVLTAFVESGKSNNLVVARVLWLLGRNPNLRVAIVSNAAAQARKLLGTISRHIQKSAELREVFPTLRPGDPWNVDAITVQRDSLAKDPACRLLGWTTRASEAGSICSSSTTRCRTRAREPSCSGGPRSRLSTAPC